MKMDLFVKRFALLLGLLFAISGLSACKRSEKPAGGTTRGIGGGHNGRRVEADFVSGLVAGCAIR